MIDIAQAGERGGELRINDAIEHHGMGDGGVSDVGGGRVLQDRVSHC